MARIELRYVDCQRDRRGRVSYWYFRRAGRRWRLPGAPGAAEFMARYHELLTATEPVTPTGQRQYAPGSLGAVIDEYFCAPEFTDLKPSSQELYRRFLEPMAAEMGQHQIAFLERRHVRAMRDGRADTPAMANLCVSVVSALMAYAVDNEYRRDNPAARLKRFKMGEHRAWTDVECTAFEARWPPGSMERRAYALARYTGQRRGDVAGMTKAHRKDGEIRVVQEKTGTEIWIAEHRLLTAELARGEQGHMSLLVRSDGSAFQPKQLGAFMADAIDAAGLPDDLVMHGLRKVAARDLADAGCSAHEIMAVTGHKSLKEVERYTRAANQKRLATAAIHRLENAGGTRTAKRTPGKTAKRGRDA